ncbi:putative integral membrane protein (TIGR00698 family) [Amycolatopsis granulosa]|nr:putative integral membrane protein (TIGR00698 family) [Amycolatopsis granulosa]
MTKAHPVRENAPRSRMPARRLVPGLLVAAAGTAVAFGLNRLVPAVSALTVAVVLGVLVASAVPPAAQDGLRWATRKFLRLGVVLLGCQLGLGEVFRLGAGTVVAVVVTVLVSFSGTILAGRLIGVPRGLALLVGTGFSICGASAIAAMDSVTESDREEVATAVTLVTLYGSAAIALVPLAGRALGLGPQRFGEWAGLSVHEVAQVVAAASPAGAAAVAIAVVVKLTRVVLLAPMVAGVSIVRRRRALHTPATTTGKRPPLVPLFVLGFLATMALRSSGLVPAPLLSAANVVTTLLFAAALFGLGSGVRIGALLRTGRRGLALGAVSTVLVALVAYGALAVA